MTEPHCRVCLLAEAGGDAVVLDVEGFERFASATAVAEGLPPCAVTVALVDEARSAELHAAHFGAAGATDVISFPDGSRDPESGRLLLGDIAACPAIAARLGPERQTAPEDPAERAATELFLYCAHGLLHLLGYADVEAEDREVMFHRQRELLAPLGIACPSGDDPPLAEAGPPPPTPRAGPAFLCGLAMGGADAIPGVSGGTVALILGFYEGLIHALASVVAAILHPRDRRRRAAAIRALGFLLPLGAGIATAMVLAVKLLVGDLPDFSAMDATAARRAMAAHPGLLVNPATAPAVFGFFFGLVCSSIYEPWRTIRRHRWIHPPLLATGAGLAALLSLAPLPTAGGAHPLLLVGAGALAVSVMLLPGVSGTLALLVVGMYQTVASAVWPPRPGVLVWFVLGLALGAAVFVPLLKRLLARAHDHTMAVLTGLMAGSLLALWPWKAHYVPAAMRVLGPLTPRSPDGWLPLATMALGGGLVVLVARWRRRCEVPR